MKTNQKAKVKSIPRCKGKKMTTYHSQPRHCGRHTLDDQNTGKTQGHTCEQCDMAPISVHPYLSLILIKWLDLGKLARFGLKKTLWTTQTLCRGGDPPGSTTLSATDKFKGGAIGQI